MTERQQSGESEALLMALGELIDDAALAHSGRSIGVLASYSVAGEVLEYLRSQGVIPPEQTRGSVTEQEQP